jgi:hypothetical protein
VSGQRKVAWFLGGVALLWVIGQALGTPDDTSHRTSDAGTGRRAAPDASVVPTVPSRSPSASKPARPAPNAPEPGTALAALASLPVKGRAPMTGYARERFGQAWLDADRNGCDTRNDILRRDVVDKVVKPGTAGCVVLSGVLHDPYLGHDIPFERGLDDQVDIDHVVALGNAWATGAARLDIHERAALANDPLGLLAVDAHSNRSKGDGDAATWLPSYRPFRCAYVARQIAVKQKYRLWVTRPEHDAMVRVLSTCPRQPIPRDVTDLPTRVDQHITDPGASGSTPQGSGQLGLVGGGSVSYANCDAVRAAGAAPIHVGDPGYSRKLDRDGDGVGCE